jgi:cyclic pyranopterin phosphate synthase
LSRRASQDPAADRRRTAGAQEHHAAVRQNLGRHIDAGALEELTLTTNGSQLTRFASRAADCGVRASTCRSTRWIRTSSKITRWGDLARCWTASAAQEAGLKIKINMVALKGFNEHRDPR